MNIDNFRKIIREEVSAELKKVIPVILNEYFKGEDKRTLSFNTKNLGHLLSENDEDSITNVESEPKKEVKKPLRMYSKNPVLNQILNETTVKIPTDSMVAMDGEVEVNKSGINIEKTLPSVFNKDYSQLLKVVDEKVKSRRG
jgi:hypothetical protein